MLTVQTLDIAFLDFENEAVEAIHADLGMNNNKPIADHDIHCGCDMFHHMANSSGNVSNSFIINKDTAFSLLRKQFNSQDTGPPVPPPLA